MDLQHAAPAAGGKDINMASQATRIKNLKKVVRHQGIDLSEDETDYNIELAAILQDGDRAPRWLAVISSDEYEMTFAKPHATKAGAVNDLQGTIDDPYGKTPIGVVDLDKGLMYREMRVVLSPVSTKLT